MRSVGEKEIPMSSSMNLELHKGSGRSCSHRAAAALGKTKPTPSKWDDAQKWLVGLSRDKNQGSSKPRNSNADDTRLIGAVVYHQDTGCSSGEEEEEVEKGEVAYDAETKSVDWGGINKKQQQQQGSRDDDDDVVGVRSVCVRDMGTEMTPIASQEPSRTATPIRATTPVRRSPIASASSTPIRFHNQTPLRPTSSSTTTTTILVVEDNKQQQQEEEESSAIKKKINPMETRALAWDEAERAKYMARFKREEVKIQAWENHEKRKAEMEMKKMELKAERMKARAQEKYSNKLASTTRIAEEKRTNAEAKLNEKAVKTSEKADYIRRTGHLPSTFSFFKLPSSFCCT